MPLSSRLSLGLILLPLLLLIASPSWIALPVSIAMALLALVSFFGALRRRARSLATARTNVPPLSGKRSSLKASRKTIAGRVEYDDERDVAMRVEVVQEGSEYQSKGSWTHSWTEVSRTVTTGPFFVVTDAGERVRVEPDEASLFWDEFEKQTLPVPSTGLARRRARVATLTRGELVWVTGRLRRVERSDVAPPEDYRTPGVGEGWVMRAPPALFVTSVPLAEHHRQRAAMHGRHAIVYAVLGLASLVAPLRWADRALGTTEEGVITGADVQSGKNGVMGWKVWVQTPSGLYKEDTGQMPVINRTASVRIGRFTSNLGDEAATTPNERVLSLVLAFLLLATRWWMGAGALVSLPWYRRPGHKFTEGGSGRLA